LYLYSLWNLHKVKLYLDNCVTQRKTALPNRVKNENIFDIAPVKPFPRNKSNSPIHFALVLNTSLSEIVTHQSFSIALVELPEIFEASFIYVNL
jgi:hypothetical protein